MFNFHTFRIGLTNGYEDGITGVHLKNKKQQDRTMKQFMAGDIGPGEMGCGIELMVGKIHTIHKHTNTQIQIHKYTNIQMAGDIGPGEMGCGMELMVS